MIIFLTVVSDLFLLIIAISSAQKTCRASKRKIADPPELSSDEEDDAEFIKIIERTRENHNRNNNNQNEAS